MVKYRFLIIASGLLVLILSFIFLYPFKSNPSVNTKFSVLPSPVPDFSFCTNTSSWKEYKSNLYSIKIPGIAKVVEDKNLANNMFDNFTNVRINNYTIITIVFLSEKSSQDYPNVDTYIQRVLFTPSEYRNLKKEPIIVSGYEGYKIKEDPYNSVGPIVIIQFNKHYVLFMYSGNKKDSKLTKTEKTCFENVFNQFVDSFQII